MIWRAIAEAFEGLVMGWKWGDPDQPLSNGGPKNRGDDGDRLSREDCESLYPLCDFCGEPNEWLSVDGGKTGTVWGCPNDHSGLLDDDEKEPAR